MGAKQSTSSSESQPVNKDDIKRLLEEQRRQIEEENKILQRESLRRQIRNEEQAKAAAREAARKEFEMLMREKDNQASTTELNPSASTISLERRSTPYSFTQNDIHIGIAQPTKTNIYPNLKTTQPVPSTSTSSSTTQTKCRLLPFGNDNNTVSERPLPTPSLFPESTTASVITPRERPLPTAPPLPATTSAPGPAPRDRSVSRTRKNIRRQAADDELNCPTCKKMYTLYIYQCQKGHSSCSNCKQGCNLCGICREPIGDVRNRSLEEYIAERKIKCPNSKDGCCLYIKMSELQKHESECPYKEMACPLAAIFGQCQWRGKLPQIQKHFNEVHPIHCVGEVDKEMCLRNTESQIVYYVMLGTFNFLFHVKVSEYDRKIYMTAQLIGTNCSAQKWSYEIHVYNKNQPRRKYKYTDICHSNNTPLMDIFAEENCATLPFSYVETFVNLDILNYKFYIKRDIENMPSSNQGARRRH